MPYFSSDDYLIADRICSRDIPFLQRLQINVVRTYGIDPLGDHSGCMTELGNAGIYVLADLVTRGLTISTTNPVWNDVLYDHYASVVDAMHNYSNLLGFIVGDDVVAGIRTNESGPYVKAAVRDMKAHIQQKNYRPIPVGYVGSLYPVTYSWPGTEYPTIDTIPSYLNCGNKSDAIDFWGVHLISDPQINISSAIDFEDRSHNASLLTHFSVPVFMASYGWLTDNNITAKPMASQRTFSDISILFGERMSSYWSGGLIYQYMGQYGTDGFGKCPYL